MKKQLLKFNKLITSILLIGVFSIAYLTFFDKNIQEAGASWWNDSWNYRKSIQVTNNTTEESNVYISLTIDTSATSTIQSDCGDLRFTKDNGEVLDYYLVSGCETAATIIHVNFPILEIDEQAIYYYYGNELADNGFSSSDFATVASDYTIGTISTEETGPGPVGHWSFNEGYGSTAHDESSGGHDGTITGATWKDESECVSGKCLYFDGVDLTRVETSASQDNSLNNLSEFTACTWFKMSSTTNADSDIHTSLLEKNWDLRIHDTGIVNFRISTNNAYPSVDSSRSIDTNKWYHVCGVYYGVDTNPELFLNGADDSSDQLAGSGVQADDSGNILNIGGTQWYGNFNGYIDEVKIYPYARTADQIKQDYNAGLAGVSSQSGVSASFGGQSDKWLSDGLVGYWKMDESATTTGAIDSSGNGNDGAYEGTASTTGGKFGRGGGFDGDSDYVDIGTSNFGIDDSNEYTIATWINLQEDVSSMTAILQKEQYVRPFALQIDSGENVRVGTRLEGQSVLYLSTINNLISIDAWHFVAVTFRSGYRDIYIDGELINSDSISGTLDFQTSSTHIGHVPDSATEYFPGNIDEVRIYNRALSKSEVQKLYEWAPGPVMHLKMDEKSGTTVYDVSGNENNGTISGAVSAQGKYGSALSFDGVDDNITVADDDALDEFYNFTISFWGKQDVYTGVAGLLDKYNTTGSQRSWKIYTDSSDEISGWLSDDGANTASFSSSNNCGFTDNQWSDISVSFDLEESSAKFYKNGILCDEDTSITISKVHNSTADLYLGFNHGSDSYFNGQIDDVRIYNYARTQKQILEDMHNGDPAKGAVLDLSFDEGVGETAYDFSIHKNNGALHPGTGGTNTATSAMWSLDGHDGGAMEFDGVDDYVDIVQANLDSTTFSVSLWVKMDTLSEKSLILNNVDPDAPWGGWSLAMDVDSGDCNFGDICMWISSDSGSSYEYIDYAYDFPVGEWTHWFVGYDDSSQNVKFHINGEEVFSEITTYRPVFNGSETLVIGSSYGGGGFEFDGELDEISIWNYIFTEEEIKKDYNSGKSAVFGGGSTESDGVTKTNSKNRDYCIPGDTSTCDPPVLELKMDKKSGSVAYDTSGNGNDGTISGATHSQGKLGAGLSFDGVDDYVDIGSPTALNLPGEMSAFIWAKFDNVTSDSQYGDSLFGQSSSGGQTHQIEFKIGGTSGLREPSKLMVGWDDTNISVSNSVLVTDKWYYIGFTRSGSSGDWTSRIFINGVLDNETTGVVTDPGTQEIFSVGRIGAYSGNYLDGIMDNIALYDYARTPAQIAYDYNKGKPIAHYSFNECSGSTIHDESGNGNHGTLNLGTTGVIATGTCASSSDSFWYNGADGKVGSSGSFDGGDDFVDTENTLTIFDKSFTMAAWIYPETSGRHIIIGDYSLANYINVNFEVHDNGVLRFYWDDNPDIRSADNVINYGDWNHVICIRDKEDDKVYLYNNGELVYTYNGALSDKTATRSHYIGRDSRTGATSFNGQIDEVKIWNYPLTVEQIKGEYNGGAVRFGP